jgi:hypothetical protein
MDWKIINGSKHEDVKAIMYTDGHHFHYACKSSDPAIKTYKGFAAC